MNETIDITCPICHKTINVPEAVNEIECPYCYKKLRKVACGNNGNAAWEVVYGGKSGWLSFDGRARRSEYWKISMLLVLLSGVVALPLILIPMSNTETQYGSEYGFGTVISIGLGGLLALFCLFAMWPVTVRRFHDRGMSGWWVLAFAFLNGIPFVNVISGIAEFVILGCLDGIPGPNAYGPDPKGRNCTMTQSFVNNAANMPASSSVEERLAKLDELKSKGVINDSEYEEKRSQILKDI